MKEYRVNYRSKPVMWALYEGIKTVLAENEEAAIEKAYTQIRRDFPDRTRSGWIIDVD